MSVLRTFVVLGFLVFFTSEFGFADQTYGKVGGSVVLNPGQTSDPITSVTWKHRTDLALEWFGGEITCYRTFEGRCELDQTTGSFTIRNLTPEDSGEYTPEINNRVLGKKELKFIKPVPKPTVSMDCNKEKTVCNLTCAADITSEFGPVTYEWKTGDTGEKVFSTNEELSLTTKNEESSFFCILSNPVSNSTSDEFLNPIIRGNTGNTTVIVLVALLLVFVVIAVIGAFFMNRAGYLPFLDKLFPCNEKARSEKRRAALLKDDAAEAASDTRQDDAVHSMAPLLRTENETDLDQAAETPNGGLHKGNETLDDEAAGKPDDSTCAPSVDTQPKQEIISKGKEALNGHLIDNTNRNEEPNDPTCNPSVDQESNPDPFAVTPEPNSQTDDAAEAASDTRQDVNAAVPLLSTKNETNQDQAAETPNGGLHKGNETLDDEAAGKPDDSTCAPSDDTQPKQEIISKGKEALNGNLIDNTNRNEEPNDPTCNPSVDQESNPDPSAATPEPNSQTENNSNGEETLSGNQHANTNEDETSPLESPSQETPDTASSES